MTVTDFKDFFKKKHVPPSKADLTNKTRAPRPAASPWLFFFFSQLRAEVGAGRGANSFAGAARTRAPAHAAPPNPRATRERTPGRPPRRRAQDPTAQAPVPVLPSWARGAPERTCPWPGPGGATPAPPAPPAPGLASPPATQPSPRR